MAKRSRRVSKKSRKSGKRKNRAKTHRRKSSRMSKSLMTALGGRRFGGGRPATLSQIYGPFSTDM